MINDKLVQINNLFVESKKIINKYTKEVRSNDFSYYSFTNLVNYLSLNNLPIDFSYEFYDLNIDPESLEVKPESIIKLLKVKINDNVIENIRNIGFDQLSNLVVFHIANIDHNEENENFVSIAKKLLFIDSEGITFIDDNEKANKYLNLLENIEINLRKNPAYNRLREVFILKKITSFIIKEDNYTEDFTMLLEDGSLNLDFVFDSSKSLFTFGKFIEEKKLINEIKSINKDYYGKFTHDNNLADIDVEREFEEFSTGKVFSAPITNLEYVFENNAHYVIINLNDFHATHIQVNTELFYFNEDGKQLIKDLFGCITKIALSLADEAIYIYQDTVIDRNENIKDVIKKYGIPSSEYKNLELNNKTTFLYHNLNGSVKNINGLRFNFLCYGNLGASRHISSILQLLTIINFDSSFRKNFFNILYDEKYIEIQNSVDLENDEDEEVESEEEIDASSNSDEIQEIDE